VPRSLETIARLVVLGSSNTDMTVTLPELPAPGETRLGGTFATSPGGKGANQAIAACRAGGDVTILTAVGDDALGQGTLERYRREGLDICWVKIVPGVPSGVALILVGERGENLIAVAPGANACLTPTDLNALPEELFAPKAVFLASLEVPIPAVVRGLQRAKARGMITVLNPAPIDPAILDREVLGLVDVLTPNLEEARALVRTLPGSDPSSSAIEPVEAAQRLRARGVDRVAITLGPLGCLVMTADGECQVPAPEVAAVDTVGAGDAFNGALAVALAEGRPLAAAAAWACAAGALAVTRPGAQGATPRRDEIDQLAAMAGSTRIVAGR
jgi:ribokinase